MAIPGPLALALAGVTVWAALGLLRRAARQQLRRRLEFIDRFRYPARLAQETLQRYPHLEPSDLQRVELGLRQFFRLCARSRRTMVAMPSRAVDAMWHAWILDTRGYARFCRLAFGRFLHHTPAESMPTPTRATEGIRRAWALACLDEGLSLWQPPRVPLIFGLDRELAIPDGFHYVVDCRREPGAGHYCGSDIGGGCGGDAGGHGDGGGHADGGGHGGADGCSGGDGGCGGGCGGGGD